MLNFSELNLQDYNQKRKIFRTNILCIYIYIYIFGVNSSKNKHYMKIKQPIQLRDFCRKTVKSAFPEKTIYI